MFALLSECRVAPAAATVDGNAWDEDDIRGSTAVSFFSPYGSGRFLLRKKITKSSPINMIPARLPVIPPATAADCFELPGGLTSMEPCPLPPILPTVSADEVAADVEVTDVASCVAEVNCIVEDAGSDETAPVLVR